MPGHQLKTPEHELIEDIREWAGSAYIGDDCATLPGQSLVTADTLVEGTHFLLDLISPAELGWKCVAVNLSDVAAMAGRPRYLMVNLTLPGHFGGKQLREFYLGIVECARQYRTRIVGGDITSGPVLVAALTLIGETHESGCMRRSGAKPGDVVAVTGDLGASAAGLWLARHKTAGFNHCTQAHMQPKPRLCESWALVRKTRGRGALMDSSDGLADALVQISRMSGVGMQIDLQALPIHEETIKAASLAGVDACDWALYGGEDFELVACIPAELWQPWAGAPDNFFKPIGKVTGDKEISLIGSGGKPRQIDLSRSFQHLGATV